MTLSPTPSFARLARLILAAGLTLLLGAGSAAQAQLRIEISGVGAQQIPVTIANFAADASVPLDVAQIVRDDLLRSGLFRLVDPAGTRLSDTGAIDFAGWKARGADAVVGGSISRLADGRYDVRFRVTDTVKRADLGGIALLSAPANLRLSGHRIADYIYEKLTGEAGVFATRIAYIVKQGAQRFELQIADSDGQNPQSALVSREPIISPSWSPDGGKLAYVSFESRKPVIYVHNIATGQRVPVANFKGSNSAPAWSPDGSQLAVVLTRDGNSQIYLMNADGSNARRLTQSSGIDTEPRFAPDGQSMYFTSDRGGGPQIYRMPIAGGEATRITFKSDYNISPRISPDGKTLAFISRRAGRFQLVSLDLASGQELTLTDTGKDESPSFAPNGKIILYATEVAGRGQLAAVSGDGRVRQKLSVQGSDVREPTWGPYLQK
jgi:TolB protein